MSPHRDHHHHHHHYHGSPGSRQQHDNAQWLKGGIPVCLSLTLFFGLGILLLFSSPRREGVHEHSEAIAEGDAITDEAVAMTLSQWCAFGSLTGYWANAPYPHSHWRIMDPACTLRDLLVVLAYSAQGILNSQGNSSDPASSGSKDSLPPISLPPRLTEVTKELDRLASMSQQVNSQPPPAQVPDTPAQDAPPEQAAAEAEVEAAEATAAAAAAKSARIMFLSDSVDRYILGYLCDVVGGQSVLLNPDGTPHQEPPPPAAPAPPPLEPPSQTPPLDSTPATSTVPAAGGTADAGKTSTTSTTSTTQPESRPAGAAADSTSTSTTTISKDTPKLKTKATVAEVQSGAGAVSKTSSKPKAEAADTPAATAATSKAAAHVVAESDMSTHTRSQPAPQPPSAARLVRSMPGVQAATINNLPAAAGSTTQGTAAGGGVSSQASQVSSDGGKAVQQEQAQHGEQGVQVTAAVQGGAGSAGSRQAGEGEAAGEAAGGVQLTQSQQLAQQGLDVLVEEADDTQEAAPYDDADDADDQGHDYDGEIDVQEDDEGQGQVVASRRALRQEGQAVRSSRDGTWRVRRRTRVSRSSSTGTSSMAAGLGKRTVRHYLPNVCAADQVPELKLMSTYIPGVHPTGPYHRNARKGWKQQIEETQAAWEKSVSTDLPPDIVVVGACLWDLARMWAHEPELVSGAELAPAVLDSWVANFTRLIMHVRTTLPKASMIVYHTTMLPRFDPRSGLFDKEHLGRRFYITQLNAAGKQAAELMGLEVLDYAALASRFAEGQVYLADAIHPGPLVGLEVANLLLNYVYQIRHHQRSNPDWQHPSMWVDRSTYHDHHRKRQQVQQQQQKQLEQKQDMATASVAAGPAAGA